MRHNKKGSLFIWIWALINIFMVATTFILFFYVFDPISTTVQNHTVGEVFKEGQDNIRTWFLYTPLIFFIMINGVALYLAMTGDRNTFGP